VISADENCNHNDCDDVKFEASIRLFLTLWNVAILIARVADKKVDHMLTSTAVALLK
jgi:hypothetical protein